MIRLNSVDHADQERGQAECKGEIAPPVDGGVCSLAVVLETDVAPDRSKETEGHRYPKDQTPITDG